MVRCLADVSLSVKILNLRSKPFEASAASIRSGAFPDGVREAIGLVLSGLSTVGGCDALLALGTALD